MKEYTYSSALKALKEWDELNPGDIVAIREAIRNGPDGEDDWSASSESIFSGPSTWQSSQC